MPEMIVYPVTLGERRTIRWLGRLMWVFGLAIIAGLLWMSWVLR